MLAFIVRKVIVIVGPTSSGKTAAAVVLARAIGGEVISADSRQVYRCMDIGTGKVTKKEMRGVPHHLLDVADPKRVYTASDFVRDGRAAISEIASRGRTPIIAGGTGFYIDALLGTMPLADVPPNKLLRKKLASWTAEKLGKKLKVLDPIRYRNIDLKNRVRLVRAIEIATALGKVPAQRKESIYDPLYIGIALPSPELKKKIHARLLLRMKQGMLREAKRLRKNGLSWKRMEELGLEYRYMARHLQGKITKTEMLSELEKEIVRYAKRQMTWFKRNKDITWYTPKDMPRLLASAKKFLRSGR